MKEILKNIAVGALILTAIFGPLALLVHFNLQAWIFGGFFTVVGIYLCYIFGVVGRYIVVDLIQGKYE